MLRTNLLWLFAGAFLLSAMAAPLRGDYPKPSPYPISWELDFDHAKPKRVVMQAPGDAKPTAYWYVLYHVVNNTTRDKVLFYPTFQLMMDNGDLFASDNNIVPAVYDRIKNIERKKFLQNAIEIGGELRQGEDQSRDGVAIWREPNPRMGTFSIFVSGFWGEATIVKQDDKDVTLRKTLQLTYRQSSDENHPNQGELIELDPQYIMR